MMSADAKFKNCINKHTIRVVYKPPMIGPTSVATPLLRVIKPKDVVSLFRPSTSTSTIGDSDTCPPDKKKVCEFEIGGREDVFHPASHLDIFLF